VTAADSRLGNKYFRTVDTSIIHDTLAVIANEVKQSSKTKMHRRHCERSEAIQQGKDAFCLNRLDCHVGYAFSQ
jgi:hypothetical protein